MKTVKEYKKRNDKLRSKIIKIQSKCLHDRGEYSYGSNTGNYDPSCDSYWVDFKCHDCLETMMYYSDSDSNDDNYRKYSNDSKYKRIER